MLISIFSWFYHTIFKVLTTQILYPKCSRMHHFASFCKKNFGRATPRPAFSLSRVDMYAWPKGKAYKHRSKKHYWSKTNLLPSTNYRQPAHYSRAQANLQTIFC